MCLYFGMRKRLKGWAQGHPKTIAVGVLAMAIVYVLADKLSVDTWKAALFALGSWGILVLAYKEDGS